MANHLGKAVWRLSCVLLCHHLHSPIRCWTYRRRARLRPQQCGSATGIRILGGNLQGLAPVFRFVSKQGNKLDFKFDKSQCLSAKSIFAIYVQNPQEIGMCCDKKL